MAANSYKAFIKDNLIVIGGHIFVYVKAIIIMPLIIKNVGSMVYGGFILLTSILGIVFAISSFGVGFKATRFLPSAKTMADRRDLFFPQFYFQLLSILILSLLLVLLEKPLNSYIFNNEISYSKWIIPMYLVSYLFYAQGSNYFRYTSRVNFMILANLVLPYLHIGLILFNLYIIELISINILVGSMAVSALLVATPIFLVIFKEIGVGFSFYRISSLIEDIKLGFPLMLNFVVDFILAGSDRYIIAFFLSVTEVGYYVPGYVLGSTLILFAKAMGTALPQLMSRAVDNNNESEALVMLNYAIKFFLLLAIPFIFGSLALSKPILILLANQEVAEKAFWISPIVALGTLFYGLTLLISNILFVKLKTNVIFKINLIAAIFNLFANLVLFYFFRDFIVAAITTLISYFIAFVYAHSTIREWPIEFNAVMITKTILAAIVMYIQITLVLSFMDNAAYFGMCVLSITTGLLTYTFMLFLLRVLTENELQFTKRVLIDASVNYFKGKVNAEN